MREEFKNSHLWSKRFLPHYDASLKFQMITYRLADSLPQDLIRALGTPQPSADGEGDELQKRKIIEETLDKGYGSCLLQEPLVAQVVVDNWKFYHGKRYDLTAYVVMPNHVHVLIKTYEEWSIGKIVWAWKSLVTKYVNSEVDLKNRFLNSMEQFKAKNLQIKSSSKMQKFIKAESKNNSFSIWQREYWDRFIRDENHFEKAVEYIHKNPVKAGLTKSSEDWLWSSAGEQKE